MENSDYDELGFFEIILQKDLGDAQSASNWKILMAYFNMIQCLESAGIGLVYGLR